MAVHDYDVACWFFDDEPSRYRRRQALVYPVLAGSATSTTGS